MIFRWDRRSGPPLHLRLLSWLRPRHQLVVLSLRKDADGWSTHVEMLVNHDDTADVLVQAIEALSTALNEIDPARVTVEVVANTGSKWGKR